MAMMKRIKDKGLILLMILILTGCNFLGIGKKEEEVKLREAHQVKAGIARIDKQGNIILDMSVQELGEEGYETGDVITITINEKSFDMPVGIMVNEVQAGEDICLFEYGKGGDDIAKLMLKNGMFSSAAGLCEVKLIDDDPGYQLLWNDGMDISVPVIIDMQEKQGHSDAYPTDEEVYVRTYIREDYPSLNDEEYANFREVETVGIKDDTLYRSSSPINPKMNRNLEADEASRNANIKTIINMADYTAEMKRYEGYDESYYKDCDIIALNITAEFASASFEKKLAQGLRFLIKHDGPYLIHCTAGKDRTGFSIAILECLMGAEADEVVSDYMRTFDNFYGIRLGSVVYNNVADKNIKHDLAVAFGIDSIFDDVDLSKCAEDYLAKIGMSEEEISKLKQKLQAEQ